jgi:ElaB/YqjD/DUF883 family membrane-anchored ribosome-binding protein
MNSGTEKVLDDLQKVLGELEHVVKGAMSSAGGHADDVADKVRAALDRAQGRIDDAQETMGKSLRRGARATDEYVKDNVWMSMGIMAAVAFVVGFSLARRQ